MVSFSCEVCNDVVKKPKLDSHRGQCRGAYFTCIDCNTTFNNGEYKSHTSCISEAQKYQGALYKPEKGKGKGKKVVQPKAPVSKSAEEKEPDGPADVSMAEAVVEPVVEEKKEESTSIENGEPTAEEKEGKAIKRNKRAKERKKARTENAKQAETPAHTVTTEEKTDEPVEVSMAEAPIDPATEKDDSIANEKNEEATKRNRNRKRSGDGKAKQSEPLAAANNTEKESNEPLDVPMTETSIEPAVEEKGESTTDENKKGLTMEERKLIKKQKAKARKAKRRAAKEAERKKHKRDDKSTEADGSLLAKTPKTRVSVFGFLEVGVPISLKEALAKLEQEKGADAREKLFDSLRMRMTTKHISLFADKDFLTGPDPVQ